LLLWLPIELVGEREPLVACRTEELERSFGRRWSSYSSRSVSGPEAQEHMSGGLSGGGWSGNRGSRRGDRGDSGEGVTVKAAGRFGEGEDDRSSSRICKKTK
jgi:hypothetical protein